MNYILFLVHEAYL